MIAKITEAGGKASKALIGGGVTDCNNDPDNTASNSSPAAEEQTEFTVTLDSFDPAKKIPVIKVIREITGLELGEAKALVEGAPKTVKEGVSKADADAMIAKITEAGGNASKK